VLALVTVAVAALKLSGGERPRWAAALRR